MRPVIFALFCFFTAMGAGDPAMGNTYVYEDVAFDTNVRVAEEDLELKGVAVGKYALFFKVGVAGLYGPSDSGLTPLESSDRPFRLEIEYLMDIPKERFIEAAVKTLRNQHSEATLRRFSKEIGRMHSFYRDVEKGDRYTLSYHPQIGTTLELNGQFLGAVPSPEFARLYFGIWLGEKPVSDSLREDLLGLK